jgi:adenylosuccinate lyase
MTRLWSEEEKLRTWLEVELAVVEALERYDEAPAGTAARIRERAVIDPARAAALEVTLKHDVIAFLTSISERLGDESRWLHYGMTSSDLLDTSLALTTRRAAMLVRAGVRALAAVVRAQAEAHRDTAMVGRSHGVHAEPTTFGLKMLLWYAGWGGRRIDCWRPWGASPWGRSPARSARSAISTRVSRSSSATGWV